jgi:ParB-like chromosome segregation protein Spo0J
MKTEKININKIKLNPNNPRLIKDDKFAKLVQSIKDFPEMLEIRPIVVNDDMIILGGNMRFKACKEAGLKEVSIIKVSGLSAEKQREFLIKDNVSGGEWDWQLLNDWDSLELESWGLDVSKFEQEPTLEELIGEEKNKPATMKITFESPEQLQKAEIDIQELLDRKYKGAYFSVSAGEL